MLIAVTPMVQDARVLVALDISNPEAAARWRSSNKAVSSLNV